MPLKDSEQSMKQGPMKRGSPDDFQTPPEALIPLVPFLKKDWIIWECAAGKGNLAREFIRLGYQVVATDLHIPEQNAGEDFLKWQPEKWDCIVTNPPYALKQEFLERCYSLGKPFALLVPLTTFETRKRQALMEKHGVQVIFFDKRINFSTPSGNGTGAWFATAWFTNWLGLPKDLTFVKFGEVTNKKIDSSGWFQ